MKNKKYNTVAIRDISRIKILDLEGNVVLPEITNIEDVSFDTDGDTSISIYMSSFRLDIMAMQFASNLEEKFMFVFEFPVLDIPTDEGVMGKITLKCSISSLLNIKMQNDGKVSVHKLLLSSKDKPNIEVIDNSPYVSELHITEPRGLLKEEFLKLSDKIEKYFNNKGCIYMCGIDVGTKEICFRADTKGDCESTVLYTFDQILEDKTNELHIFKDDIYKYVYSEYKANL